MAESLNAEQIAERRTNLQAFRSMLFMKDDSELTTTLLMQEEWLATVDELQEYARDAHIIRGLRTRKCLMSSFINEMGEGDYDCTNFWRDNRLYCAPCYLRSILKPDLPATSIRPMGESFTSLPLDEGTPREQSEEEAWREQYEAQPPTEITELDLHSISLHTDPLDPRDATPEEYRGGIPKVQERIECGDSGQAHVWVKLGKVGFGDHGLTVMDWGDAQCLRCHIPVPVPDFDEDDEGEFFTDL